MRRNLLVIQAAIGISVLIYAAVGYYIRRPENEPAAILAWLKPALLFIIIALYPTLRFLQRKLLAPYRESGKTLSEADRGAIMSRSITLFALAELPGIFGLVMSILGAPPVTLFLSCGLSLFYLAVTTPPGDIFK